MRVRSETRLWDDGGDDGQSEGHVVHMPVKRRKLSNKAIEWNCIIIFPLFPSTLTERKDKLLRATCVPGDAQTGMAEITQLPLSHILDNVTG